MALCALWGAVWATGAEAMLNALLNQEATKRATVYLDDISVLVSELPVFMQVTGFTSLFFKEWGITMNADKTVVVANPQAITSGDLPLPYRKDEGCGTTGHDDRTFPEE